MPVRVTTARTLPWLLSSATEKSWMVATPLVSALACRVQTMIRVMHSSRKTVPGGAIAAVSKVVRLLTCGIAPVPSLCRPVSRSRGHRAPSLG
jgi:hypothetical protein